MKAVPTHESQGSSRFVFGWAWATACGWVRRGDIPAPAECRCYYAPAVRASLAAAAPSGDISVPGAPSPPLPTRGSNDSGDYGAVGDVQQTGIP